MSLSPFGRTRGGDPLEAARAVDESDLENHMAEVVKQRQDLLVANRDSIRADALTFVARCRIRAGGDPAIWTPLEARMGFTIADMGAIITGQELAPLDPAFDNESTPIDPDRAANLNEVDRALRRGRAKKAAAPKTDGEPESLTLPSILDDERA